MDGFCLLGLCAGCGFGRQLAGDLCHPSVSRIADHGQHFVVVAEKNGLQQARVVGTVAVAIALADRAAEDAQGVRRGPAAARHANRGRRSPGPASPLASWPPFVRAGRLADRIVGHLGRQAAAIAWLKFRWSSRLVSLGRQLI